jgi:hypothetical protein
VTEVVFAQAIGLVLLIAAVAKLASRQTFEQLLRDQEVVPAVTVPVLARFLPMVELLLGTALLVDPTAWVWPLCAALLFLGSRVALAPGPVMIAANLVVAACCLRVAQTSVGADGTLGEHIVGFAFATLLAGAYWLTVYGTSVVQRLDEHLTGAGRRGELTTEGGRPDV